MSAESTGPTLPDWSEKHQRLRGKWEWFCSQHWQREEGRLSVQSTQPRGREQKPRVKSKCWKKHNLNHLLYQNWAFKTTHAHTLALQSTMQQNHTQWWNAYRYKKETWHVIFKPKACIDSKLSHPTTGCGIWQTSPHQLGSLCAWDVVS